MKVYQSPDSAVERDKEYQILEWNGIKRSNPRRRVKQKFRIVLYQFDTVAIYQSTQSSAGGQPWIYANQKKKDYWKQISPRNASRDVSRAKSVALRALYLLGYDVGMVEVCVYASAPKAAVSQIFYHEALAEQLQSQIKKCKQVAEQRAAAAQHKEPVLGADVEFVLRHKNGKFVLASRYFSKRGRVGYDAIWLKGHRNKHPLVELRPAPSKSPRTLFQSLYSCMKGALKKINNSQIEWLAGGNPLKKYPIGGHIHFSNTALHPQFIRALDNYLTLPLALMESKESYSRRPKYGGLGDFREQFHGGFEYRTPPSWIVHPVVARGVLCLAKVIASDFDHLNYFPLQSYEVQRDFALRHRESLASTVHSLWSQLKKVPSYHRYEQELDRFYQLIEQRYVWDEFEDIRPHWKLA